MCGIAGILDPTNTLRMQEDIKAMTSVLRHRGPDGEGFYVAGPISLGHTRLSIIDLDSGSQPMTNEDRSIWVVFNGEIYNFQELRQELVERGHFFRTKSDTEVIVHGYEEYGADCVKKLRGMFAFAIWDSKKRQLLLARDRLGKKPLYYFFDGKTLIFASEIKGILQVKYVPKDLDIISLKDYFTYHYIPFPRSIFKNIFKLPPAHRMIVRMNSGNTSHYRTETSAARNKIEQAHGVHVSIEEYWDLDYQPDFSLSEDDWIEALEEKLIEAVKIRLVSDVPLGAFLSGGIDSSSIVALMSEVSSQPVRTFSIGFNDQTFDELAFARMVAKKYETEHHEYIVSPNAIDVLPKLAWGFDEPFADASAVPTFYLSKMARENVTVVLSGDGGDETFAGYDWYSSYFRYKKFDIIPPFLRKAIFGSAAKLMPMGMKGKGTLQHLSETPFLRYSGQVSSRFMVLFDDLLHSDLKRDIELHDEGLGCLIDHGRISSSNHFRYGFLKKYFDRFSGHEELSKLQYVDTKTYLAEDILTKVDRASMLCSLETRAPLLDHELLELVSKIPARLKFKNRIRKYVFKKMAKKYLPNEVIYRKKMGFSMPLSKWFKSDFVDYSRDILLSNRCKNRRVINTRSVERLLEMQKRQGRDLSPEIWALLFFENWCLNWLD